MSTQTQSLSTNDPQMLRINSSFSDQNNYSKSFFQNKKHKFTTDPRLSIITSSVDPSKSKLEIYKQHLLNIQLRKQALPHVPEPSIIQCFKALKEQKSITVKKQKLKKQISQKKLQYEKLKKIIDKYTQSYESKEQSMKEKQLLSKILSTKLELQFQKTKQKFRDLQFSKIMNTAQKKLYFYQLAQIFFNDKSRQIFSFERELSRTDQQIGICLGYLGFLIQNVAKISGVEMWIKFKFRGPRSTITIYDPKVIETFSNSSQVQNSNMIILQQTFVLHPKEPRLNQALSYLSEQIKQIMKYSLGISVSKSDNFYQLCEDLSKYILNI